jgi:hypothetical protein
LSTTPLFSLQPVKRTNRQSVKKKYLDIVNRQESGALDQAITVEEWTRQQRTKLFRAQCALVEQHRFEECLQEISCALYLESVFHGE